MLVAIVVDDVANFSGDYALNQGSAVKTQDIHISVNIKMLLKTNDCPNKRSMYITQVDLPNVH